MIDQTKMGWGGEQADELRRLWDQGNPKLSTKDIGRQLGMSKNAVIGKARRLNLAPRPSPINRTDSTSAQLTPLVPAGASVNRTQPSAIPLLAETTITSPILKPAPAVAAIPTVIVLASKPILHVVERNTKDGCSWVYGDPKKQWYFCDAVRSVLGGAYCDEHRQVVYSTKKAS
ncbi:hypothetical protein E2C06_33390 [Dankookia rubra]|uniref:GcrA cell cycle regulator n=1 Tax=Dankookia rubra TaxID=1442381 RepID=A0A4R5Q7N1_9PROT|nr:GcrA family cell cycle regulator [Dankookia rubra]TDH58281.1 hypothetical protein E2C06_33390 [Dankookia rubra]